MKSIDSFPPPISSIDLDEKDMFDIEDDMDEVSNKELMDVKDLEDRVAKIEPLNKQDAETVNVGLNKLKNYLEDDTKEAEFAEAYEDLNQLIQTLEREELEKHEYLPKVSEIREKLNLLKDAKAKRMYVPLLFRLDDLRYKNLSDALEYADDVIAILNFELELSEDEQDVNFHTLPKNEKTKQKFDVTQPANDTDDSVDDLQF